MCNWKGKFASNSNNKRSGEERDVSNRYIVFDVETPNGRNNRMSAIGVTVVEDDRIADEWYSLVNPECDFDDFNVSLTGISPKDVENAPTFPQVWETLKPLFDSGVLIAHNAPFDMSVLAKCINAYEIDWKPEKEYACTVQMGRIVYPDLDNHKLDTMSRFLGINLGLHHDAGCDSRACAEILINYIKNGINVENAKRIYDFNNICTVRKRGVYHSEFSYETVKLNELKNILEAISFDGTIEENEAIFLKDWLDVNIELSGNYPFDRIYQILIKAMADGMLESNELNEILDVCRELTDPVSSYADTSGLKIKDKVFCLTGEFSHGPRNEIEKKFVIDGGIAAKSVTKKTDYLIVGNLGSEAWAAGNYGTKVKKAMELQEKGSAIKIIRESDIEWA